MRSKRRSRRTHKFVGCPCPCEHDVEKAHKMMLKIDESKNGKICTTCSATLGHSEASGKMFVEAGQSSTLLSIVKDFRKLQHECFEKDQPLPVYAPYSRERLKNQAKLSSDTETIEKDNKLVTTRSNVKASEVMEYSKKTETVQAQDSRGGDDLARVTNESSGFYSTEIGDEKSEPLTMLSDIKQGLAPSLDPIARLGEGAVDQYTYDEIPALMDIAFPGERFDPDLSWSTETRSDISSGSRWPRTELSVEGNSCPPSLEHLVPRNEVTWPIDQIASDVPHLNSWDRSLTVPGPVPPSYTNDQSSWTNGPEILPGSFYVPQDIPNTSQSSVQQTDGHPGWRNEPNLSTAIMTLTQPYKSSDVYAPSYPSHSLDGQILQLDEMDFSISPIDYTSIPEAQTMENHQPNVHAFEKESRDYTVTNWVS